jgi:4,5-dihydroxyphthalate decarboxylase
MHSAFFFIGMRWVAALSSTAVTRRTRTIEISCVLARALPHAAIQAHAARALFHIARGHPMTTATSVPTVKMLLGDYPNTLPLKKGEIKSDRVKLEFEPEKTVNKVFKRVVRNYEFDVAELAIATYLQAKAFGKPLVLLPIVMRGKLPHATMTYNANKGNLAPKDLEGKRVGIRAWAQTTPLWVRGILQNDYGVDLDRIKWTTFEDSHCEDSRDPPGVERAAPGKKLRQMLLDGEFDAANVSEQRDAPHENLKTVIPDAKASGQAWYEKYKVIPINHMIVAKESFVKEHPDLVQEIFSLLAQSKKAAGLPPANAPDQFPIGIEPNRKALEMAIKYAVQQRLIPRAFTVDELFNDFTRKLGA